MSAFLRPRLGERDFWLVQAGVIGVTLIHTLLEIRHSGTGGSALYEGLRHVPVVAYAIPVAYASLRYGLEGGLLTGTLVTLLSLPNVVVLHGSGFGWVGELATVVFVVAIGIVLAVVVEREQRSRARAESVSRRLALLDDIASSMGRLPDPSSLLVAILEELVDALDLDAAGFLAVDPSWPTVVRGTKPSLLETAARRIGRDVETADLGAGIAAIPVMLDEAVGVLAVAAAGGGLPADSDLTLLGSVAREIGIALENARLQASELRMRREHLRAVTRAQEEERSRVARELHDEAQTLVTLSRGLDRLAAEPPGDDSRSSINELRELAVSGIESMRRMSRDLRPPVIDQLGLVPALQWLADRVSAAGAMEIAVEVNGTPRRLSADAEVTAFRVAQEALNNSVKHSEASQAGVSVEFRPGSVRMTVHDDGRGFDVRDAGDGPTFGLAGIRERTELVGGSVNIASVPGRGTSIDLIVPG